MNNTRMGILFMGRPGQDLLTRAREVAAQNLSISPSELERSSDFFFVGLDESEKTIGVEKADEIIRMSSLSAIGTGCKVFLIDSMDKMTVAAQNRLLKTLEESSSLIIGTCYEDNLLPTVKSRMQLIRVSEKVALPEDVSVLLDRIREVLAEGCPEKLFVILNLVKEKDSRSFFSCHRDNVKDVIATVASSLMKPEIMRLSSEHLEKCMSVGYTKDDFFMYVANVVEIGGK